MSFFKIHKGLCDCRQCNEVEIEPDVITHQYTCACQDVKLEYKQTLIPGLDEPDDDSWVYCPICGEAMERECDK